nr:titin homolog [Lepeophtheirus salmonis]
MSQKLTSKRRARSQSNSKSSTSFEIDRLQNYVAQRIKSPCKTVKKFLLYQSPTSMKVDSKVIKIQLPQKKSYAINTPSSSKRGRPIKTPSTTPRSSSVSNVSRNSISPTKSQNSKTPSSSKRRRSSKTPSATPRSLSASNVSRNTISPTKSQNIKTPSSSKRGRTSKTPSARPRSLSASNVSRNTNSPTKSQDSKTPSSSKRGRTSKTPSATPRSLSASNVSRNTISPTKSQDSKTPSSSKRRRSSKTPSATPRSLSASNVSRNTISPTKSQDSKTPSSSKRGRTSKTPSATPRNSSASNITKNFGIPTKSQKIKTPSSLQGRPRKSHSTGRRSSFVPNTTKFKRSKSCSNMNSLEFKKQKNICLSSSKVNISRSKYYLQNSTPLVSEKSLMSNRVLHSPSVFINASLEGISIPSSSKTPANSPSSGVASMNFSQRLNKSLRESLGGLQNSSFFDFDSVKTPKIPIQVLVSPLLAESIHIDGRILKPSRSKPGKRVSLNNIDVQRYNEISHRKRHSIGHIDVSEEYSNLISTPKKRKNMKDYKNKGMKYRKKVNESPISSYDNLTGVKELFTTPEKFGEVMTESTLESILNSPENSNASLVMPKSLLNKENQDGASSESSISVKILPNKRTARSRVAKKEDTVVEEQSIKRSTRGSNKSESEKSPSISRSRSNNDALGNVSPAPKLSTRGRKRLLESKDVEKEELTQKKINESVSEEVEEISTTKRSTRSKKVLTKDDGSDVQSSQPPKTRGRKPKSSNNDVDNTPIKKVTRSMRNNKKTTVLENDSKERNSSVESSSNIDVDNTTAEKVTRSRGTNKKPTVSESDSKERNSSVDSSSNIDVDNTAVEKVTRSRRNNKKSTVLESDSKESNSSVESSSYGNESKSDVLSPDERSNRGTQTTLSDSDKPPTDKSEKVALTRKRSSRNKQNESNSTETAPITRVTRKTRVELSESENNESNILQKSPIEVGKPLRTRGRAHKLSETEVVVDTKKEPSPPPTKPRRTRRGKKVQEEEEEPTNTNTPKTRAKSTNTANDESEPQQSSTKRRGRKKKDDDNLESSLTNKENVEINPKGRRKRNVQTKATETTESSPP